MTRGTPHALHDNPKLTVATVRFGADFLHGADPGNFELTITKDGSELYRQVLKHQVPSTPAETGGSWTTVAAMSFPFIWAPGDWRFRYRWTADIRKLGESQISLQYDGQ